MTQIQQDDHNSSHTLIPTLIVPAISSPREALAPKPLLAAQPQYYTAILAKNRAAALAQEHTAPYCLQANLLTGHAQARSTLSLNQRSDLTQFLRPS